LTKIVYGLLKEIVEHKMKKIKDNRILINATLQICGREEKGKLAIDSVLYIPYVGKRKKRSEYFIDEFSTFKAGSNTITLQFELRK